MATPTALLHERFQGVKTTFGTAHHFRRQLYPHWPALLGAVLCSIGYTAARLLEPWPLKYIFDNVLIAQPLETPSPWLNQFLAGDRMRILMVASMAILALAAIRGVFYYYQNFLTSRVGQEVVFGVRRQLFAHVQRLPLSFHNRSSTGDLLTRLTGDVNMLRDLLVSSMMSIVSEVIILVGFVVVLFIMDWRLALMALSVIPVIFLLVAFYSSRIRESTRKQRRREGEIAGRVHEVLAGIHIVQTFSREDDEDERLRKINRRSLKSGLKTTRLEAQLNRSVELSIALGTAVAIWYGATQVIAGRLTPGDLIVFVAYMQSFYRPLRRISRVTERATKASSCAERITSVLDQTSELQDGPREAPAFKGQIEFRDVVYGYDGENDVLNEMDLTIAPGQTVAVVGPSGAGKTTLLGLVPRLYDPTEGAILIDGHDLRELSLKSLRDQISLVPQDGALFGGDILDNIAYGKPDATDQEIEAAARAACIHDFIIGLPDGYETTVGERGVTLSGGQRQRLAIARAIIRDAPIVLLDEPTTGLDAESEALVMEALDRLLTGRTAIVIAHRFSTIRRADLIVVMEDGRIIERGSHDELMARGGRYRALAELQFVPNGQPQPRDIGVTA